ncbi:hypothetical protein BKA80DRAFT_284484 [Phyllosticta citrichinensis]
MWRLATWAVLVLFVSPLEIPQQRHDSCYWQLRLVWPGTCESSFAFPPASRVQTDCPLTL